MPPDAQRANAIDGIELANRNFNSLAFHEQKALRRIPLLGGNEVLLPCSRSLGRVLVRGGSTDPAPCARNGTAPWCRPPKRDPHRRAIDSPDAKLRQETNQAPWPQAAAGGVVAAADLRADHGCVPRIWVVAFRVPPLKADFECQPRSVGGARCPIRRDSVGLSRLVSLWRIRTLLAVVCARCAPERSPSCAGRQLESCRM